MTVLYRVARKVADSLGYDLRKANDPELESDDFRRLHARVRRHTMTSRERQLALRSAVSYVIENKIEGDIVECGVWKGGSAMLAALTLLQHGVTDRKMFLYDTYAGMSEPTAKDIDRHGETAHERWRARARPDGNDWDFATLDEVRNNVTSTGYPADKLVFIKGKVEETIPGVIPDTISVLRLDTDWYESTKHELEHLFPRLAPGGVLILDDYGHWKGARQATDEYINKHGIKILLNRIDYTGRIAVKR